MKARTVMSRVTRSDELIGPNIHPLLDDHDGGHRRRNLVVVGVDGSQGGQAALRWALIEGLATGHLVVAVNVWTFGTSRDFAWVSRQALSRESHAILKHAIIDALGEAHASAVVRRSVEGEPVQALVDVSQGAVALVLGEARGSSGYPRRLGSVAEQCVARAHCPVVIVPPHLRRTGLIDAARTADQPGSSSTAISTTGH